MKKIVALVLAMVMVLGLATTAFAYEVDESKSYGGLYTKVTDDTEATATNVTVKFWAAEAPEYAKDKSLKDEGCIAHYDIDGVKYVKVDAVKDATVVVYKDAAMKNAFMYLKEIVDPAYVGTGKAFTNFGEECGQYAHEPAKTEKFYTFGDSFYLGVKATEGYEVQLMVDGKLVPVVDVTEGMEEIFVKHSAAFTIEDGETVSVACSECGKAAVYAANWMSVPEGAEYVADTEGYWYWAKAAAPAGDATVESPKTFDAGIAMYVGMSVMAAAGSAVVLKKKD